MKNIKDDIQLIIYSTMMMIGGIVLGGTYGGGIQFLGYFSIFLGFGLLLNLHNNK